MAATAPSDPATRATRASCCRVHKVSPVFAIRLNTYRDPECESPAFLTFPALLPTGVDGLRSLLWLLLWLLLCRNLSDLPLTVLLWQASRLFCLLITSVSQPHSTRHETEILNV